MRVGSRRLRRCERAGESTQPARDEHEEAVLAPPYADEPPDEEEAQQGRPYGAGVRPLAEHEPASWRSGREAERRVTPGRAARPRVTANPDLQRAQPPPPP